MRRAWPSWAYGPAISRPSPSTTRCSAGGPYIDEDYADRRGKAFIVAVDCAVPSGTCFCASMGTGPEVRSGFDIGLIELDDGYVVRAGSEAGQKIVDRLSLDEASSLQQHAAAGVGVAARAIMSEQLGVSTDGLKERLVAQLESDGWEEIAERCLACTSCTMVCPTCFCTDVRQTSDLLGTSTESSRQWASCFTLDFARVAHGNFRPRVKDRYRQWLTHKFSTWVDQFGSYGCVGCGRCITWCPVGIDVRKSLLKVAPVKPPMQRSERPVPVSANPGHYSLGTIAEMWAETKNVYTMRLTDLPESVCCGLPGQFLMLDLPGYSAVPISISRYREGEIYLTVRTEGASTRAITALPPGLADRPARSGGAGLAHRGGLRPGCRHRRRRHRSAAAAAAHRRDPGAPGPLRPGTAVLWRAGARGPALHRGAQDLGRA